MKKILLTLCLILFAAGAPLHLSANDNVLNRDDVFYDIQTNQKYTGTYTNKYSYNNRIDISGLSWVDTKTYLMNIPVKNGVRNGVATLYQGSTSKRADTGEVLHRTDNYKSFEAHFSNGKLTAIKEYGMSGGLKNTTRLANGKAEGYDQTTGELTHEFSYIETKNANHSNSPNKAFLMFLGNSFAKHGKLTRYLSNDRKAVEQYRNGLKHGPYYVYKGTLLIYKGNYAHDVLEGDFKQYCEDGRLKEHRIYVAGEVAATPVDQSRDFCDL